ncbi:hypothetical protein M011DRAFT_454850 [Sporormia fimetaria CBS 119925]|uniref:AB hydrolase-1 domain-containing protein n=1 Tax=Sporormia fimetaria CBS 119925 TaxID=1340428 RepID=A0A6A6VN73_9PLEO|nr:hypothetical protein M011DRAFT_454850 [Sporormia fimetaria CBS 119925]
MRPHAEPRYSFTIPSIHDDTTLDCRLYLPEALDASFHVDSTAQVRWIKRGIIVAHPYAPFGGSYDDRVVGIVVGEFLSLGHVVGTFNFRGAHGSKGRTSWSGKPEVNDYISFAAFFIHYLSYIRPHPAGNMDATLPRPDRPSAPAKDVGTPSDQEYTIILGGYSHGSLIVQHLPPVPSMLQPFFSAPPGSAMEEIVTRARTLSHQTNAEYFTQSLARKDERCGRHENILSVVMGGEETSPDQRRSSREVTHSTEGRRSSELRSALRSMSHTKRNLETTPTSNPTPGERHIRMPRVRYLLISPLTGPLSFLAAPGLGPGFWPRALESTQLLGKYPSLVLYGERDSFSSASKLRAWATQLSGQPDSQLCHRDIPDAGHFWCEHGVEGQLRASLREWGRRTNELD